MSLRTLATFLVAIAIGLTTQTAFAAPTTPPLANNDAVTTPVNTPVLIPALLNDMAASGNPIDPTSVKVERPPRSGITALQSGQVRYTPATGFVGTDSFTYTVKGTRVIVLSSVAFTLLATPREGAVQPPPPSDTGAIVGSGLRGQSRVRVFDGDDGDTAAPSPLLWDLSSPSLRTRHRSAPSSPSTRVSAVGVRRVAGCDLNGDGTDEIIVIIS